MSYIFLLCWHLSLRVRLQAQQYCETDVNAGSTNDALHHLAGNLPDAGSQQPTEKLQRQHYFQAMDQQRLTALLQRIDEAHKQVSRKF